MNQVIKLNRNDRRAVRSVNRRKRYATKEITIQDFLVNGNIDTNPIHQRPDSNDIKKKRGIITSIFSGIHIGVITLNDHGDEYEGKYRYESIDGGHRKRAIMEFVQDKFKVDGQYFSEMSKEDREFFLNTKLNFCEYHKLTNEEKGLVFRSLNTTTTMNDQEMRNSYGDTDIANLIRNAVRGAGHEVWDYVQFDNNRLATEELVARLVCMLNGDVALATAAHSNDLFDMYGDDSLGAEEAKELKTRLNSLFAFIIKMANARASRLSTKDSQTGKQTKTTKVGKKEFSLWSRVYFYCQEKYGKKFKVKDYNDFWNAINNIYCTTQLSVSELDEKYLMHHQDLEILDNDKGVAKQFNSCLSEWKNESQLRYCVKYLEVFGLNFDDHITKQRTHKDEFSREQKVVQLSKQNYRCGITGEDLNWKNAHAGHKVSVKNGGKNTLDNLVMLKDKINLDMGDMNFDDYKKLYDNREEGQQYVHKLKSKND